MPGSERRTHGKGRLQDGGVGERGSAGPRGGWTGQEAGPGGWAWGGSPGPGRASSGAGQRRPSQARDGAVARAAAGSQPTLWTRTGRGAAAPRAPSPTGASQPPSRPLRTPAWNNPKSIIDRNRIVANLSLKPIMELHSSPFQRSADRTWHRFPPRDSGCCQAPLLCSMAEEDEPSEEDCGLPDRLGVQGWLWQVPLCGPREQNVLGGAPETGEACWWGLTGGHQDVGAVPPGAP